MLADLALLESIVLVISGAWLIVLGGSFLLSQRNIDRWSPILIGLAGTYALLWKLPVVAGFEPGALFHVELAQPVFLTLLSGALFLWSHWLFDRHVDRLVQTTGALRRSVDLHTMLVDILAHDLRNPLTTARLEADRLALASPDRGFDLDRLDHSLDQAQELLELCAVHARLTDPRDRQAPVEDLVPLVAQALEAMAPKADGQDVVLELHAPNAVPCRMDPLVRHAVSNLVDNAIKWSPGGSTVVVHIVQDEPVVRIQVLDEGPGVDPGKRDEIFARFNGRGNETHAGLGLGLSIVRRIAELTEGDVLVQDRPGGGSCFELVLPLQGQAQDAGAPDPVAPELR